MREAGATLEMRVKENDVKGTAAMMLSSRLSRGRRCWDSPSSSPVRPTSPGCHPHDRPGPGAALPGGTAAAGRAGLLVDPLSTLRPALVAAWQSGWEPGSAGCHRGAPDQCCNARGPRRPQSVTVDGLRDRRAEGYGHVIRASSSRFRRLGSGGHRWWPWAALIDGVAGAHALFLLAMGGIHLSLFFHGVGGLLGVLFVLTRSARLCWRSPWSSSRRLLLVASVLSLLFMVGTLLALVLALTIGFFGIREMLDFQLVPTTLVVESIRTVVLVVTTALVFRLPALPGAASARSSETGLDPS